jgi:hypothetical protein
MIKTYILFLLLSVQVQAQIKGVIHDATTKEPVPYVNMWIEGKEKGASADENGAFTLTNTSPEDIVLFSAVGYADTRIKVADLTAVVLLPQQTIELDAVDITPRVNKHIRIIYPIEEIEELHFSETTPATSPTIVARYIPYKKEYEATPFLKELLFYTRSDKRNTIYLVRLYAVKDDGSPGELLHDTKLEGKAAKGKEMSVVNVSHLNIRMPEKGFFVAVEWLLIERNEFLMYRTGSKKGYVSYNPRFVNTYTPKNEQRWVYDKGQWKKNGGWENKFFAFAVELTISD